MASPADYYTPLVKKTETASNTSKTKFHLILIQEFMGQTTAMPPSGSVSSNKQASTVITLVHSSYIPR